MRDLSSFFPCISLGKMNEKICYCRNHRIVKNKKTILSQRIKFNPNDRCIVYKKCIASFSRYHSSVIITGIWWTITAALISNLICQKGYADVFIFALSCWSANRTKHLESYIWNRSHPRKDQLHQPLVFQDSIDVYIGRCHSLILLPCVHVLRVFSFNHHWRISSRIFLKSLAFLVVKRFFHFSFRDV